MQRHIKGKIRKGWWLFHATDLLSLIYPCFIIGRLLGIFPYKINTSTFKVIKSGYILSTLIICISCGFDVLIIYDLIFEINVGSTIKTIENVTFFTLYGFIVFITYVSSGAQMRSLQSILKISSKLPPELYQKLSRWMHFKDIFGTIFIVVQVLVYFSKPLTLEINDGYLILIIVHAIHYSVLVWQINMMYMNCVCVLNACFMRINENVARIPKLMVNDIKSCIPRLICPMPRNQFLLIKLKILKKQHLMASDAMKMLNVIFSPQLLATVIVISSTVVFELYFYIVRWQDGLFIGFDWRFFDIVIIAMTYYSTKLALLGWACETCKNQIQELGITIHEVLNITSDAEMKKELQLFSLQILHRKDTFSAKGITMDCTILTTIFGNIATYILILIQFLIALHSCDEKYGISQII